MKATLHSSKDYLAKEVTYMTPTIGQIACPSCGSTNTLTGRYSQVMELVKMPEPKGREISFTGWQEVASKVGAAVLPSAAKAGVELMTEYAKEQMHERQDPNVIYCRSCGKMEPWN